MRAWQVVVRAASQRLSRPRLESIRTTATRVYGRNATGRPDFGYSEALKKVRVRWDESSLDRWLNDPDSRAPETDMVFQRTCGIIDGSCATQGTVPAVPCILPSETTLPFQFRFRPF